MVERNKLTGAFGDVHQTYHIKSRRIAYENMDAQGRKQENNGLFESWSGGGLHF